MSPKDVISIHGRSWNDGSYIENLLSQLRREIMLVASLSLKDVSGGCSDGQISSREEKDIVY